MNTPGWGFGLASSSLVGQSLGTGREGEAGAYAHDALRFAVAVYVLAAGAVLVLAGPISGLFVSDPAVLPTTVGLVRVTCLSVVLWGIVTGAKGPLRASGDTRWPLYGHVLALLAFVLPVAYLGAVTPLGVTGLALALLLETGVPAAVTYYRFRSDAWKLVSRACLVIISPRSSPSENASLPMMLIWRTLDLGPSSISNTTSTRFCASWTICGSTVAANRP